MNVSRKIKKTGRSVLDIGPAVGIDNEPYDPHCGPKEDFTTGTGLVLGPSTHDSSKAPRVGCKMGQPTGTHVRPPRPGRGLGAAYEGPWDGGL